MRRPADGVARLSVARPRLRVDGAAVAVSFRARERRALSAAGPEPLPREQPRLAVPARPVHPAGDRARARARLADGASSSARRSA